VSQLQSVVMDWIKKSSSSIGGGPPVDVKSDTAKLDNLIDDSDMNNDINISPSKLEVLRLKTLKFMASSWFGHIYTNFFLLVSVFSCGQYIYQTYLTDDQQVP
jgi:hypothetical protein